MLGPQPHEKSVSDSGTQRAGGAPREEIMARLHWALPSPPGDKETGRERVSVFPRVWPCGGRAVGTWVSAGPGGFLPEEGFSERVPFCRTTTLSMGHGARGKGPVSPNQSRRPVGQPGPTP